jgi:D-methionine transport system substrate-binding protein
MKFFKQLFFTFIFIVTNLFFFNPICQAKEQNSNIIKVGTISGPETELMSVAKTVAKKKYNLDIKIVEFTDYTMPNAALSDGSLDANIFQHKPYLDAAIKAKGYKLVAIGKTFVYPVGIYSTKVKRISNVPDNAIVAIPNDPSNEARALLLLSKAGLITLKPGAGTTATSIDVLGNPKHLQFKELDAAQLPRVLPDVTLAVINTNYAVTAGLYPNKDAIFVEDKTSPYVNLIVVRAADANNPKLKELVEAFQSPEVLAKAQELFKGQAVAGWL